MLNGVKYSYEERIERSLFGEQFNSGHIIDDQIWEGADSTNLKNPRNLSDIPFKTAIGSLGDDQSNERLN